MKIEGLSGVDSFGYDKRFDLPGLPWSGESMTKDPMSKPETTAAPNFLRQIVQADLDAGKHAKIVTRFPRSPTVTCTSATPSRSA